MKPKTMKWRTFEPNFCPTDPLSGALFYATEFMQSSAKIRNILVNEEKKCVTIVWTDGKVTISKCSKEDTFNEYAGIAIAFMKRFFASNNQMNKEIESKKKYVQKKDTETSRFGEFMRPIDKSLTCKNTKKVFSAEKYKEWADKRYDSKENHIILSSWANECDGLTIEEMSSRGYIIIKDWLIEVPSEKEENSKKNDKQEEENNGEV